MTRHDPLVRVRHMLEHTREACEMAQGHTRADLDRERQLELSLVRLMEIVGEAAARTPADFRETFPDIEWREISDLRNRLIHAYDAVDLDILWKIITDELPLLIEQCEFILRQQGEA